MKWWVYLSLPILMGLNSKTHDLVILANDYRQEYRTPILNEDERLHCAARLHLAHILNTRVCTYVGPHGQTVGDKIKHCGYVYTEYDTILFCQELTLESWFQRIYLYPNAGKTIRDYRWKTLGVAGDELWWVLILAR